jgi:Leucine-rich repeat (LRR) protein
VRTLYQQSTLGKALGRASLTISVIGGTAYVTSIYAVQCGFNASNIAALARALPRLESLYCDNCEQFKVTQGSRKDHTLPADFPLLAPNLKVLRLPRCNLVGQLPASYGNWSSLLELTLDFNYFKGTLPASYAYLSSLRYLDLTANTLTGVSAVRCECVSLLMYLALHMCTHACIRPELNH